MTSIINGASASNSSVPTIPVSWSAVVSAASPTSHSFQLSGPPEPIVSDYVELATLILLFIVGAPLNLAAYTQVLQIF